LLLTRGSFERCSALLPFWSRIKTIFSYNPPGEKRQPPARRRLRVLIFIGLLVAFFAVQFVDIQSLLPQILTILAGRGILGILMYMSLYIVACLFFFPSMVFTITAGAVWGVALGTPLALLSSTLGAALAFLLGRYVARDWANRQIKRYPAFLRIDEAMAIHGWKIVALTRLSPAFPYAVLNYGYGLTRIGFGQYVLTTGLFMLPGAFLYTNIGSMAGGVIRRARTTAELVFLGAGILATIAVTIIVSRFANSSLDQTLSAKNKERTNA